MRLRPITVKVPLNLGSFNVEVGGKHTTESNALQTINPEVMKAKDFSDEVRVLPTLYDYKVRQGDESLELVQSRTE